MKTMPKVMHLQPLPCHNKRGEELAGGLETIHTKPIEIKRKLRQQRKKDGGYRVTSRP